jgi:cytochrome c peroxidase
MPHKQIANWLCFGLALGLGQPVMASSLVDTDGDKIVIQAGHASLQKWRLPERPPAPPDNETTPERIALGKMLFFDPRLSGTGQVTCVSCHFPERGWSDGMPTSIRFLGEVMAVASPTIVNVGYNTIFMWDGRQPSLEAQATGGQGAKADINAGMAHFGLPEGVHLERLKAVPGYVTLFDQAYPGEGITRATIAKAIAAFERSVISRDSPFDRWVAGDPAALTAQQVRGFSLFVDPQRGNCSTCHWAPNFTDNGFHNVGLKSSEKSNANPGRYKQRPVALMKGAFKTPTLREVSRTAPYFHDGSALSLREVVEYYARGGDIKTNLSPSMRPVALSDQDKHDIVTFLEALSGPQLPFIYPILPR